MDERTSVRLIEAMSAIWTRIRQEHPDVPGVVLLAAPAPRGETNVLGHFAPLRWKPKRVEGQLMHEVVVVAEHLNRTAFEVLETLLHEAAHALNCGRGIKDCTASQYHNQHFRDAAQELGLDVARVPNYGYAYTSLPLYTARRYEREARALDEVLVHRRAPAAPPPKPPGDAGTVPDDAEDGDARPTSRSLKATCQCPFIIRVSRATMAATVIVCSTCGTPFRFEEQP